MKTTLLSIALLMAFPVHSAFYPTSDVDGISDKQRYLQRTFSGDAQFGFRCDSTRYNREMYIVFGNTQNGSFISGTNDRLQVKLRVDRGKVHTLNAVMSNSNNKFVFIPDPQKSLMTELKKGSYVHLRAFNRGSHVYEHKFNLSGSSRAIDEVSSRCDMVYQTDSFSSLNREIMQLQKERDSKIRNIEREYSQRIAELRAKYY